MTHQFTTSSGKRVLFVEVEQDANNLSITNKPTLCLSYEFSTPVSREFNEYYLTKKYLLPGNWQFLALDKDISEEQAREIVKSFSVSEVFLNKSDPNPAKMFSDYCHGVEDYGHSTALQSFRSLLRSLKITGTVAVLVEE